MTIPSWETLVPIPNTTVKPLGPMIVPQGVKVGYRRGLVEAPPFYGGAFFANLDWLSESDVGGVDILFVTLARDGKRRVCELCLKEEDVRCRFELSDEQWQRVESLLPGQPGSPGRSGDNNRLFLDAVLWIVRTGAPWRDLPERFRDWNSLFERFNRWAKKSVWQQVFDALQDPDLEWVMLDATIVRAHVHAVGARKKVAFMNSADRVADSERRFTRSAMDWAIP